MANANPTESYPLHRKVWNNEYRELERLLESRQHNLEAIDPRGRTPLMLAVTLGHLESVKALLNRGANANATNAKFFTVVQEATATGDPEILQKCLQYRDYQRYETETQSLPLLLQKLKETPDFYVEMKWEFTSWLPLVSRVCPSDTYKVWKKGECVRVDTTLLGFENMRWDRGSRSFIFKGNGDSAVSMEIDHDSHQVITNTVQLAAASLPALSALLPSEDTVANRLTSTIATTYLDTEKIAFERSKSGIWGWRSDRTEVINAYSCKVFSASNVELVTKTRTEHLTEHDKKMNKKNTRSPLEAFLGIAEAEQVKSQTPSSSTGQGQDVTSTMFNPCAITPEAYFDPEVDLGDKDIGRPLEQTTKVQKFKATLWLCEDYPLSLQQQVLPIIDLMAASNAHFRKLKDFITLQLPAGFPIKIEIPLFHVLNARITFGNIFGLDKENEGVVGCRDPAPCCAVDPAVFNVPSTYSVIGSFDETNHSGSRYRDEDDAILQFAIQQSLLEQGTESDQVTLYEALHPGIDSAASFTPTRLLKSQEERDLQLALQYSLMGDDAESSTSSDLNLLDDPHVPAVPSTASRTLDEDLLLALQLSRQQDEEDRQRREREEEEELTRILELSLLDK